MEIEKCQQSRHLDFLLKTRGQLDGLHFKVAEVRSAFSAVAHDDHFDLRHDVAVAAAVLAHEFVQVCEAAEVFDFLLIAFNAHAGVPAFKGIDKADDVAYASAVDELGLVVGVVGDEGGLVASGGWAHNEVAVALGDGQGGVELCGVVCAVDGVELGFRLGVGCP